MGLKFLTLCSELVPLATSSHPEANPGACPKHLINIPTGASKELVKSNRSHLHGFYHLGNSKGCRSSMLETRPNTYFLI